MIRRRIPAKHVKRKFRFALPKILLTKKGMIIGGGVLLAAMACVLLFVLIKPASVETQGAQATPVVLETASPTQDAGAGGQEIAGPEAAPPPTPAPPPDLKEGDENESVKELQERLMDLNYLSIDEPTSYFGYSTEFALQLFQRQHGLQIDGIFGGETRRILFSGDARPYTMLEGAKGSDIEAFQKRLKELGYLKKVTSYYGTETVKAVKAFQKTNKLKVDGKAGEHTLDLIYSPKAKGPVTIQATIGRNIDRFISLAKKQLGRRYILGTEGPRTFDCSGLVYYCLTKSGIKTGRYNAAGYSAEDKWKKITSMSKLKKGDLVFFRTNGKRIGHTGIYIGNGEMIDASSSNGKVVRRSCFTSFWKSHFVVGRRPWK